MTKDLKKFNMRNKQHGLWLKGIAALSLSIALQAKSCTSSPGVVLTDTIKNTPIKELPGTLDNINDISFKTNGQDYLHAAVSTGDLEKVKIILARMNADFEKGFQYRYGFPNAIDANGRTVLGIAIERNDINIVQELVANYHIDPNDIGASASNQGLTSLLLALKDKKQKIAMILLQRAGTSNMRYNMNLTTKNPKSGATPLHLAIENKYEDVAMSLLLRLFLDDLLAPGLQEGNVFHMAARSNMQNLFKALLERILELLQKSSDQEKKDKISQLLFAQDKKGRTVFARAYLPEHTTIAKMVNFNSADSAMFRSVLIFVRNYLTDNQLKNVSIEIQAYKGKQIKEEYALKLLGIVSEVTLSSLSPSAKFTNDPNNPKVDISVSSNIKVASA
ncbi:ankyrin repeat domain-containing protein [Cardinium endosymbiont of Tipula unca]|uniref:ankyrin repeat domain-containing protein n=1 Tax=Cardinium endosymbiont of Tipula unca TaxID=3066216 RepID=UPI0030D1BE56